MANEKDGIELKDPELQMLTLNKQSGYNYREHRQEDWTETYLLYRDKVKVNRLLQRQSVNIPLVKQTVNTILKDNDDMPLIYFENLDNDKQAEIFQNEYWSWTISPECNNMEIKDIVDKRQEILFGRTFDQMQIADGRILMTIEDPMDILVDRYTDPTDIDTARFLIHTHIFKPLSALAQNEDYDKQAVQRLQKFYATQQGLLKADENKQSLTEKNKKLRDLGVDDVDDPVLGETYVELSMHFVFREEDTWFNPDANEGRGGKETVKDQYMMYVEADDQEILMKKPLEKVLGTTEDHYWQTHLNYNSWAEEVERQDFWSDGKGDVARMNNKIVNVFFSQKVENRTMASFGMNYYNSDIEGFTPPSIEPEPWGWVGVPTGGRDIREVFQKVDIPTLSDSLEDINFVIGLNDRATGATATQQGVPTERQITLGEVKLALAEGKELTKGMSKFYTNVWQKRAEKFLKLIEANPDKIDAVKIYKKGKSSNDIYETEISPKDWMTKSGYRVKIWSQDQKDTEDLQKLQKLAAVRNMIPGNPKLEEIIQRKSLEFADLKPEEINDIIRIENEKRDAVASGQVQPGMTTPPRAIPAPTTAPRPVQQTPGQVPGQVA